MNMRIAIIGAGINGIALALCLKKAGIKAYLYEQSAIPRVEGTGIYIWPQGMHLLKQLVPEARLLSCSQQISRINTRDSAGNLIHAQAIADPGTGAQAYMFHRKNLYQLLFSALDSDQVIFNKKLVNVKSEPSHVNAFFEDGTSIVADILVGADGLYSKVRNSIFPEAKADFSYVTVVRGIAQYDLKKDHADDCDIYSGEHARIVTYPINLYKNEHYWFAALKNHDMELNIDDILHVFDNYKSNIVNMLKNTSRKQMILSHLHTLNLKTWHKDKTVLIGDAAHTVLPTLGYGFTLGLENAFALATSLLAFKDSIEYAFIDYEKKVMGRTHELADVFYKMTILFYHDKGKEFATNKLNNIYQDFFRLI